ncbi:hypothetical protein [Paenibacillus pseudetheri]|uniref:Uncharacterized protein n=1 Tax=Paenibacillus pseudetheri TaxID=2897682 RepID=A0ABN8FVF9_9BACL|nr:hypothetical protein [Paenibacillus pseudetheri]CAH1059629.1 hypothetical protein PAECIP111894_05841 [Paenibacillus pseudetheri]
MKEIRVLLADDESVLFFFPILFNLMLAFKSYVEIMKDAIAFPKTHGRVCH